MEQSCQRSNSAQDMLFAIKYGPAGYRTEADRKRVRRLFLAWEPPFGVDIIAHYHYVSGGGVVVAETESAILLFEALEPFKTDVQFHTEPVINVLEALAVAIDVEEWADSILAASKPDHLDGHD